jgi:SAM-dependent methyltransferase
MYPMGSGQAEQQRLEAQLGLLWDNGVNTFISNAQSILEIGCGVGTNLKKILALNSNIKYVGTDISPEFIKVATERYVGYGSQVQFMQGDATQSIAFEQKFDVVFIRLVLWCVGHRWSDIIQQAKLFLNKDGHIIIFEPDDQMLFFSPHLTHFEKVIFNWQQKVKALGQNPMIGREIYGVLLKNNYKIIQAKVHSNLAHASNKNHLIETAKNLEKIFMSKLNESNSNSVDNSLAQAASSEIQNVDNINIIHDGYFSYIGQKNDF